MNAAKREATFYIMNTSRNKNWWGVTQKALEEGAPTIKGKPIGSGKGYKIDKHYPAGETIDVGTFNGYAIPSSYMTATAKITDDTAWGKLTAGDWGSISVVITASQAHCSVCGEDITDEGYAHSHIASKEGYIVVDSFKFERVDFVNNPAYPQAGVLDMEASSEDLSSIITLVAGVYEGSHSTVGGASGSPGANPNPEEKRKKQKMSVEELQAELDKKVQEIEALKAEAGKVKTLEAKLKELEADDNKNDDKEDPVLKQMKERLEALETERHQANVNACAEARFKAGLTPDLEAEKERLKGFSDAYLATLIKDSELFAKAIREQRPGIPKTGYTGEVDITSFDAAFEAAKGRLIPAVMHQRLSASMGQLIKPEGSN